ncbi:c-type cytochrome [Breoghania sp. L-A4]|uniref:c-type cytochrome n=1 Tax=Breoghania sp. L-A4 TaxID=2304600 RepID=UPI000E360BD1|nr:c-type cytochrome [Breoghania sp. L-A4]AXS40890.1 cytochrome c [Breoghania sp. L-A4]
MLAALAGLAVTLSVGSARADEAVERGKYLVALMGCNDCHTPGYFFGKPDMAHMLSGSEVAFEIPGMGAFAGPNLTPDKETGLGDWTNEQIVTALQTGERPDGRMLAPAMPWRSFAQLTPDDAMAIVLYLKTLPAVSNEVPGPFGPGDVVPTFISRILPPGQMVADPQ